MNIQEQEEDYGKDFTSKREATFANRDAKNNDKVNAMRSEDSFTQQSRRSKINERIWYEVQEVGRKKSSGREKKSTVFNFSCTLLALLYPFLILGGGVYNR